MRGYSLLVLCALASTLLLIRLLESVSGEIPTWVVPAYVGFVAAGIATHLYGCAVLLVHAAIVIARGERSSTWVKRWSAGLVLGGLVYLDTISKVLNTHNQRTFHGSFPRELVLALLGQARVAAVALWLTRSRRDVPASAAVIVAFAAFIWLVLQPQFLVVRYLIWVVPGVALAAAFVVARRPIAIVLVAVGLVAMVAHDWSEWTITEFPTSQTAALIDSARAQGMEVCGLLHTGISVAGYTRQPARPKTAAEFALDLRRCRLA